jgi:hypothetical protein
LAEKILGTSHVNGIVDGPETRGSVAESMKINAKSKGSFSPRAYTVIDRPGAHRSLFI